MSIVLRMYFVCILLRFDIIRFSDPLNTFRVRLEYVTVKEFYDLKIRLDMSMIGSTHIAFSLRHFYK